MTQIGLCYFSRIVSDDVVDDFVSTISTSGLSLTVEREEEVPIQGGLEWLAPTALIVFLAKPYFEAFLSEMGKDHYNLLKKALKKAANRLLGPSRPEILLVHSKGKVKSSGEYSLAFSIHVKVSEDLNLKLLFPTELREEGVHEIIEAYSDFIAALYAGKVDEELIHKLSAGRVIGKTMLVAYDFESKEVGPVDPIPRKRS
ncbi:MAG: hypothetical protein K9N21_17130 [Deltaproteobacteria bacterium]|nr:hypothetical protein [Deltaproteobacteria bacterium]